MENKILITFETVHQSMAMEDTLNENNIKTKTIPTPREITVSCGLSILIDKDHLEDLKGIIDTDSTSFKGIYRCVDTVEKFVKII